MIRGRITVDDYIAAQRLHSCRLRISSIVFAVLAIIYGVIDQFVLNVGRGNFIIGLGLISLATTWFVNRFGYPNRARKSIAIQPEFQQDFIYSWNSEAISGESSTGRSNRPWKYYKKIAESEKIFLLYQNDNLYEVIPKRWFVDEAQLAEFRTIAKNARRV
jgi:YcxB-like protein